MEVKIDRLDHQARGIAKINQKVVFVENALPDEIVDINVIINKKNYSEAAVNRYIKTSDKRIKSDCPYYEKYGGCDLRHISYKEQLKFKQDKLKQILKKFGDVDIEVNPIIENEYKNYRNKASFKAEKNIGYYKKRTNDIIKIDSCLLVDEKINKLLIKLQTINLKNIKNIIIRSSKNIDNTMVVFEIVDKVDEQYLINQIKDDTSSIIIKEKNNYRTIYKLDSIYEKLNDLTFIISPDSFFQVNTLGCIKLYDKVLNSLDLTGNEIVLDLYCGTGTIGIYLSKYVKKVIGVEINKYAIEDANKNKELNKIKNIEFICNDVGKIIDVFKDVNVIVVDPPRSGLDKNAINNILKVKPKDLVYVSCDPVTLSRDLKILKEFYDIKEITPVDMFPGTLHVETVSILKKKF